MAKIVWIPEAPKYPGVYAIKNYPQQKFNVHGDANVNITMHWDDAMQFDSKEDCQAWCDNNPDPVFVPQQHMIDN